MSRTYDCLACGMTFEAKPKGPLPHYCPDDRNYQLQRRATYSSTGRTGRLDETAAGYALAATSADIVAKALVAREALTLAAICRMHGWPDERYLDDALDALADIGRGRDQDVWALAERHAAATRATEVPHPRRSA